MGLALGAAPRLAAIQIIGYVNYAFQPGNNLFGNPLASTNDVLSHVIPSAPEGTSVALWNPVANAFEPASVFSSGAWSLNLSLPPGTGALLHAPVAFTNTFVGVVLAPDGSWWDGGDLLPPPPFAGPNGLYLWSCKSPMQLSATNGRPVFDYVVGRGPLEGEQFIWLDLLTQTYQTTTWSSGSWNNGEPALRVGEAAFFNIGPTGIPEPGAASLLWLEIGLLAWWRAQSQNTRNAAISAPKKIFDKNRSAD